MRSEKSAKRIALFDKLKNDGNQYILRFDAARTIEVLDINDIHSDEEREIINGVKTRKRKRPLFRDEFPLVNQLLAHLNSHTKYNITRVNGSPSTDRDLKDKHRILLSSFCANHSHILIANEENENIVEDGSPSDDIAL
jgi:hypothetical protein